MLAFALMLAALANQSAETGWRRLLPDREDINNFEFHPGSVRRASGRVEVWARHDIRAYRSETSAFVTRGRRVWLSEIDCPRKLIRELRSQRRDLRGEPSARQDSPDAGFVPIDAGSIGDHLRRAVCPAPR